MLQEQNKTKPGYHLLCGILKWVKGQTQSNAFFLVLDDRLYIFYSMPWKLYTVRILLVKSFSVPATELCEKVSDDIFKSPELYCMTECLNLCVSVCLQTLVEPIWPSSLLWSKLLKKFLFLCAAINITSRAKLLFTDQLINLAFCREEQQDISI